MKVIFLFCFVFVFCLLQKDTECSDLLKNYVGETRTPRRNPHGYNEGMQTSYTNYLDRPDWGAISGLDHHDGQFWTQCNFKVELKVQFHKLEVFDYGKTKEMSSLKFETMLDAIYHNLSNNLLFIFMQLTI